MDEDGFLQAYKPLLYMHLQPSKSCKSPEKNKVAYTALEIFASRKHQSGAVRENTNSGDSSLFRTSGLSVFRTMLSVLPVS